LRVITLAEREEKN